MTNKKPTLATLKSFIKKNADNLYIKKQSRFDGMQDCVVECEKPLYTKIEKTERHIKNTLGIRGVWVIEGGSGRNLITEIKNGFEVYNCCGSFALITGKAA